MGYFDALTSTSFKIAPDGRRFFFPFGILGRGYAIPSEQAYERLRRHVKIYTIAALALVIGGSLHGFVAAMALAALCMGYYFLWARAAIRGLAVADETLSLTESMTTQALTHHVGVIWALQIVSLLFVAAGIVMLVVDPAGRLQALFAIAFFGLCAVFMGRLLILRRATSRS